MANSLHWLEIAEYLSVAASAVGLIFAVVFNQLVYALLPVLVALLLNLFNRYRWEQRTRWRTNATINRISQQLSEDIEALEQQLTQHARRLQAKEAFAAQNPEIARNLSGGEAFDLVPLYEKLATHKRLILSLQEQYTSFEESLKSVVDYLNKSSLPPRVEQLEKTLVQLSTGVARIPSQFEEIEQRLQAVQLPTTPPEAAPTSTAQTPLDGESISKESSRVLQPQTWNCVKAITGHTDWVSCLAISPSGEILVSGSFDNTIKVWSLLTGEVIHTLSNHSKGVFSLAISFSGKILASGSWDNTIKLWRLDRGELINTLSDHTGSVRSLAISQDGKMLISGSVDKTIKLWDISTGESIDTLSAYGEAVQVIALSFESNTLFTGGEDGIIRLWQIDTRRLSGLLTGNISGVRCLAISPDAQICVAGTVNGTINLWDLSTGELTTVIKAHSGQVTSCVFNPHGQTFISGSADGTIKCWQLITDGVPQASLLQVLSDDSSTPVTSIAISPNDETFASGSADGKIKIWQS